MARAAADEMVMSYNNSDDEDEMIDIDDWPADMDLCDYDVMAVGPSSSSASGGVDVRSDPESFNYKCLQLCEVERLLNEAVLQLSTAIPVTPSLAKVLLHHHKWNVDLLVNRYRGDCHQLLIDTHLKPPRPVAAHHNRITTCPVCCRNNVSVSELTGLACSHRFCRACWLQHCAVQLEQGISTGIECMEAECRLLAPEDFVLHLLSQRSDLRAKYEQFTFRDHVNSHPLLRFCPGVDCSTVIHGRTSVGKKVSCNACNIMFCFLCGHDYHAPTSCETIRRWLMKCADDSETANYISAHTKDCPQCHSCIEKNGGCNHMQCTKCKHHFCWMCLGDWRNHGSEYYECSRYKENPSVANEATHVKARRALEKYLHYFERWENHHKSLQLEQQLTNKIKARIEAKVNKHEGTWIDWQYLHDAATLLTQCRYTLQYTYPFAFYLEPSPRKDLFEYQQAQLEKEIEELSWRVERAESTDRGDLQAQMHVARQKRLTLLQDFFNEDPSQAAATGGASDSVTAATS